MEAFLATLIGIWEASGFNAFFVGDGWKYAVMIAVYDGETFAGAGVANFNHEGVAEINVDHSVVSPTFKAFIWNTANESAPMMTPIDITTWVE